ncbi:MAG: hypothetical protein V3V78_04940 [Candidatus Woesearchaeota archaeon]
MEEKQPVIEGIEDIVIISGNKIKRGRYFVNFGDKKGPLYKDIWGLIKVNDKYAYIAQTEDDQVVVNFDGVEGPKYRCIRNLKQTEDGYEYLARNNDCKMLVNKNGEEILELEPAA